jgi:hypothetical protein
MALSAYNAHKDSIKPVRKVVCRKAQFRIHGHQARRIPSAQASTYPDYLQNTHVRLMQS